MQDAGETPEDGMQRARELLDAGVAASQANDSAKALSLWAEATQALPSWGLPHFLIGSEYASQGQWDQAEAEIANAVLLAPQLLVARYQLGLLQFSSARVAAALVTWQPLIGNEPEPFLSDFVEGFATLAQDRFEEARALFERGLARPGVNPAIAQDVRKVLGKMPAAAVEAPPSTGASGQEEQAHVLVTNYGSLKLH